MSQSITKIGCTCIFALLVASCAGTSTKPSAPITAPTAESSVLQQLITHGQYRQAAAMLEMDATANSGLARQQQLIQASKLLLQVPDAAEAWTLLERLDLDALPLDLQFNTRLLHAETGLLLGRVKPALELQFPAGMDSPSIELARYHELRAQAFRATGNLYESAHELALLDQVSGPDLQRQSLLLETLGLLSEPALARLKPSAPVPLRSWIALAHLLKQTSAEQAKGSDILNTWQSENPEARLSQGLFSDLANRPIPSTNTFNQIAVLLPETGRFKKAAETVRRGILTAFFASNHEQQQKLRFYDSNTDEDIHALYQRVVADGADFIIGPLAKTDVTELSQNFDLKVPVLTLNYSQVLDQGYPTQLFQFGLAPEDDVRQVAERMRLDGLSSIAVLAPSGSWGDRLVGEFTQRWQALGGDSLTVEQYDPAQSDFGEPISALLNLVNSRNRYRVLKGVLGKPIEYEPRRRKDIDGIFILGKPRQSRLIRPQLQFHHASRLPVYAASFSYTGSARKELDRDLDDIIFCDLPWILNSTLDPNFAIEHIRATWPDLKTGQLRLFAMGMDAYRIAPRLNQMQTQRDLPIESFTGGLQLGPENRIRRRLLWAQFKHGNPEVIGYTPLQDPGTLIDISNHNNTLIMEPASEPTPQ